MAIGLWQISMRVTWLNRNQFVFKQKILTLRIASQPPASSWVGAGRIQTFLQLNCSHFTFICFGEDPEMNLFRFSGMVPTIQVRRGLVRTYADLPENFLANPKNCLAVSELVREDSCLSVLGRGHFVFFLSSFHICERFIHTRLCTPQVHKHIHITVWIILKDNEPGVDDATSLP